MEHLKIKGNKVFLNQQIQLDKNNKQFRYSGLRKNSQLPSKWIKARGDCWYWIYTFIYLEGGIFEVEIDYNDKFVSLTKK